jgi:hypothetical protein
MKNRRIIKEDMNNPGGNQFTDPILKKAFSLGCWPSTVTGPMKDLMSPDANAQAIYQQSKRPENIANPHVFDKPNGVREWRTTAGADATVARTSKWYCEKLEETKNSELSKDQDVAMKSLIEYSKGTGTTPQIVPYEEGVAKPVGEGWNLKTLSELLSLNLGGDYANLINDAIKTNKAEARVWILQGAKQYPSNVSKEAIAYFNELGYVVGKPPVGKEILYNIVNLQQDPRFGKDFQTPFYVHYELSKMNPATVKASLATKVEAAKTSYDKATCREVIQLYYQMYITQTPQTQENVNLDKEVVRGCTKNNKYPSLSKKIEELQFAPPVQLSNGTLDYALNVNARNVRREHKEELLKSLIRESLLEVKETKKKTILAENKIVSTRLTFISENVTLKTKKQKEKYFNELLSEMVYLNSQGFNKGVISEGLWDMVKGLFGNGADSVMQYFKEYIAKWLIGNLTPMDPNGWIGGTIVKAIGNLPIGDIPKLTDCNFLTALLSKSIAEEALDQVKNKAGMEGPFYDILRNAIVESLEDTSFGSKIEHGLGSVICPMLGGVTSKMGSVADKLKQNALTAS